MDWYDRLKQITVLSSIDESEPYVVDQTAIGWDSNINKFVVLAASGCSCWEGKYEEEQFTTLKELHESLIHNERQYNPSLKGVETLINDATTKWMNQTENTGERIILFDED